MCMCVLCVACLYVSAVIVRLSALTDCHAWVVVLRRRRSTWGCMPSLLKCEGKKKAHGGV
jgi:hypothetical protein